MKVCKLVTCTQSESKNINAIHSAVSSTPVLQEKNWVDEFNTNENQLVLPPVQQTQPAVLTPEVESNNNSVHNTMASPSLQQEQPWVEEFNTNENQPVLQPVQQTQAVVPPSPEVENTNNSNVINPIVAQPVLPMQQAVTRETVPINFVTPIVPAEQPLTLPVARNEETPQQFARRFEQEFHHDGMPFQRPIIHHALILQPNDESIPQPVPLRDADTPWVEELHEGHAEYVAPNPWVEEFNQGNPEEKAATEQKAAEEAVQQEQTNSEPVVIINDLSSSQPALDARQMNGLQQNLTRQTDRMRNIVNSISLGRDQGRVHVQYQARSERDSLNNRQVIIPQIQSQGQPQNRTVITIPTVKPAAQRLPARL